MKCDKCRAKGRMYTFYLACEDEDLFDVHFSLCEKCTRKLLKKMPDKFSEVAVNYLREITADDGSDI